MGILAMEVTQIRTDFPLLSRKVHGKPLVYLDNGATTQKPQIVIDAITDYYTEYSRSASAQSDELSCFQSNCKLAVDNCNLSPYTLSIGSVFES